MITRHLATSWHIELYNEDHDVVFLNWRLRNVAILEETIKNCNAKIALFKPILDTHLSRKLLRHFPQSNLLFTFRHYNDVINSSIKLFGPHNWSGRVNDWIQGDFAEFSNTPPRNQLKETIREMWSPSLNPESLIGIYWFFYNRLYYDLELHQDDHAHLVSYEATVLDPHSHFKDICRFLDLPFEEEMIKGVFSASVKRKSAPMIDRSIKKQCDMLWERMLHDAGVFDSISPLLSI